MFKGIYIANDVPGFPMAWIWSFDHGTYFSHFRDHDRERGRENDGKWWKMMISRGITVNGGGNHPKMAVSMWKDKKDMNHMKFGELTEKEQNLFLKQTWEFVKEENKNMITARIGTSFLIQSIQSLWLHMYIYIYIIWVNQIITTSLRPHWNNG